MTTMFSQVFVTPTTVYKSCRHLSGVYDVADITQLMLLQPVSQDAYF